MRIGLVLNVLDEDYQISIYKGICDEAAKRGIELFCIQLERKDVLNAPALPEILKSNLFNLSGVIYLTSVMTDIYDLQKIESLDGFFCGLPVISVGQKVEGIPSLITQTDFSMKQLVEHLLLSHKYRNFLFLGGPQNHPDAISREIIFRQTIEAYKPWFPDTNYKILHGAFTEEAAIDLMTDYVSSSDCMQPDVVVCSNDNMAIGVYKFFKINKSKIKECAVTGFDDIPQLKYQIPSITSVHQPVEEMGKQAVINLLQLVEGKKLEPLTFIESSLIFRESCGCMNGDKRRDNNYDMVQQIQTDFVKSEQQLRLLTHFSQYVSNARNFDLLRFYIKANVSQLDIYDFSILLFDKQYKKIENAKVNQFFIYHRDTNTCKYDGVDSSAEISFTDFYEDLVSGVCRDRNYILKYLVSGGECIGIAIYACNDSLFSYISSLIGIISQTIIRINDTAEKQKRSEYLEKEVEKRTHELIDANNKRMEVEAEVLKISEMERQRFSNDLHDDICQRLAGISMLCRSYSNQEDAVGKDQMIELAQLITDTLQTTRQYAHNSFPVELNTLGLKDSLNNLCNSFMKQSEINCRYVWEIDDSVDFNTTQRLNVFRIIQEALHNILKHAQADNAEVSVVQVNEEIIIKIADDGRGIAEIKDQKSAGLGLNSMQYRANQIGASFEMKQNAPKGTVVQVVLKI